MKATERNIKIAGCVAVILEKEGCTVDEVKEILSFLVSISGKQSTVQVSGVIAELLSEFQRVGLTDAR